MMLMLMMGSRTIWAPWVVRATLLATAQCLVTA
jgi:hypothetical protein